MKCVNCKSEIKEDETFCKECGKTLIEKNKSFNDLSETKELTTLSNLLENTKGYDNTINVTREELNNKKANNKSKKIILIILLSTIILLLIVISIIIFNKDEKEEETQTFDYEKIIKEYGNVVEKSVKEYKNENSVLPIWEDIATYIIYDKYDINCEIKEIYDDSNIFLDKCSIDGKSVKISYGTKQEKNIESKTIQIYKTDNIYSSNNKGNSLPVGEITCKSVDCSYIFAARNYVIIKEEAKYYLYDYINNSLEFGPFNMESDNSYSSHLLMYNNIIYGIYYTDNDNNIYNINTKKVLKNIKGQIQFDDIGFSPSILLKYNYVILRNNNKYNFINLKTGNISFSISENISEFIEDEKTNIVYMTVYTNDPNKFKIINSNGKLLFDGKEFSFIKVLSDSLVVSTSNEYYVYDNKLKLKISSKKYDKILYLCDEAILVVDNSKLKVISLSEEELASYDINVDDYIFNSYRSGIQEKDGKKTLYLYLENTSNKDVIEYYYTIDAE